MVGMNIPLLRLYGNWPATNLVKESFKYFITSSSPFTVRQLLNMLSHVQSTNLLIPLLEDVQMSNTVRSCIMQTQIPFQNDHIFWISNLMFLGQLNHS